MRTFTIEINETQRNAILCALRAMHPRDDEQQILLEMFESLNENDEPNMIHGFCY